MTDQTDGRRSFSAAEATELARTGNKWRDTTPVHAVQITAEYTTTRPDGSQLHGNAGDWLITLESGEQQTVERSVFEQTYAQTAPGRYEKRDPAHLARMDEPFTVDTPDGPVSGEPGDYIAADSSGVRPVPADQVGSRYAPLVPPDPEAQPVRPDAGQPDASGAADPGAASDGADADSDAPFPGSDDMPAGGTNPWGSAPPPVLPDHGTGTTGLPTDPSEGAAGQFPQPGQTGKPQRGPGAPGRPQQAPGNPDPAGADPDQVPDGQPRADGKSDKDGTSDGERKPEDGADGKPAADGKPTQPAADGKWGSSAAGGAIQRAGGLRRSMARDTKPREGQSRVGAAAQQGKQQAKDKAKTAAKKAGKTAAKATWNKVKLWILANPAIVAGILVTLAVIVGIIALVTAVISNSGDGDIPYAGSETTEGELEMAPELVAIYQDAARGTDVPWTLVAAIAAAQTDHGRYSPYDDIDRAPWRTMVSHPETGERIISSPDPDDGVSSYPAAEPAIGNIATDPGVGPFLLRADAAYQLVGYDADPSAAQAAAQNTMASASYVARQLDDIAAQLHTEAFPYDEADPATVDQFWLEAVNRLQPHIADPTGAENTCGLPASEPTAETMGEWIDASIRCAVTEARLDGQQLQMVREVEITLTGAVYHTYDPATAAAKLSAEARTVAWAFSQWDPTTCNPNATLAGILPLPAGLVDPGNIDQEHGNPAQLDRCDPEANLRVAAARLVSGETTLPSTRPAARGTHQPAVGGWANIPWALGSNQDQARQASTGGYGTWQPDDGCISVIQDGFDTLIFDLDTAAELITPDGTPPTITSDRLLGIFDDAGLADAKLDPRCGSAAHLADDAWYDTVANQAGAYQAVLAEATSHAHAGAPEHADEELAARLVALNDPQRVSSALSGLSDALNAHVDTMTAEPYQPGVDPAVARLNPDRPPAIDVPATSSGSGGAATSAIAYQVVGKAVSYGGLFVGDDRAGNVGALGGIPLVIEDDPQNASDSWLYPHPTTGDAVWLACGTNPNTFYARSHLARLWETMCTDAAAQGVRLVVSSGTRTRAQQEHLKATKGNLAATPGRSRHERGAALDIGEIVDGRYDEDRSWTHTIVGCYDPTANTYRPLPSPVGHRTYAAAVRTLASDVTRCNHSAGELPIKRLQTYGLIYPLCQVGGYSLSDPTAIECLLGTGNSHPRENWHLQPGKPLALAGGGATALLATTCGDAQTPITIDINNPQTVAVAVYDIFYCEASSRGLDQLAPTPARGPWDPNRYGIRNKAQQIAIEAVVVGYCESAGYNSRDITNPNFTGNYGGVFQMGNWETATYIPGGATDPDRKLDPLPNITGAARYHLSGHGRGMWDGWGPWAVVNTDLSNQYPNHNDVRIPLLQRFPSTRVREGVSYVGQQNVAGLPNFALDPTAYPPAGDCNSVYKRNQQW